VARKTQTTRVFQLARDLGVSSKDIVTKCKAEEIPGVTNHMSAVSLGLAATIREWFGAVAVGGTAVQTAPAVDVKAAREKITKKKARRKASRKSDDHAESETSVQVAEPIGSAPNASAGTVAPPPADAGESFAATAPAVEAAPAEPVAIAPETPVASAPSTPVDEAPPVIDDAPAAPAAETVEPPADDTDDTDAQPLSPDAEPPAESDDSIKPVVNVPTRPKIVAPAGRRLQQPTQTKLAGPKVIRVESPEPVPAPRPRRVERSGAPTGRGGGGPRTGRGIHTIGPDGPPGAGAGGPIREGRGASSRRNKRRSASARPEGQRSTRPGGGAGGPAEGESRGYNWREQDLLERERRLNRSAGFIRAARRDNLKRGSGSGHRAQTAAESGGVVRVEEPISLKILSAATGVKVNTLIRQLVKSGRDISNADVVIDASLALELMVDHDIDLEVIEQKTAEAQIVESFEERERVDEHPRSPVVTILGHVDHGKTTLLDSIRDAKVAEGEAGGITQATSAFRVPVTVGDGERMITFIDTPGHEAFTEMRSRGAKVTDIVVLVVAADDGVMPQTVESIAHAKAAGVPIVVALNKVDKPEATDPNIQRILGQLAEHELNPVDWGGSTEVMRISALKGEGIPELLEVLDYQSQLLDLKADFGGPAEGTVIESQVVEGRGPVARILVQEGKLKKGDFVAVGRGFGRVRDITDDHGKRITEAGPSTPIAISGINEVPDAGDKFYVVKNLKAAEAAAGERKQLERERELATERITLDNIFEKLSESERKELPLIVKADVQGSLETLRVQLPKIGSDEVVVTIKHTAVGGVNESDVGLAEASGAVIIGFNVTAPGAVRRAAEAKGVDIRFYDVIYDLTDEVKKAAEGLLEPELKLEVLGQAEVRQVFKVSKVGMIAGCYVTDGNIERNAQIRVTRDGIVIEKDRRLEQLKRFKDDAKAVNAGQECGMRIDGYDDIRVGDVLECYKTREVRRTL